MGECTEDYLLGLITIHEKLAREEETPHNLLCELRSLNQSFPQSAEQHPQRCFDLEDLLKLREEEKGSWGESSKCTSNMETWAKALAEHHASGSDFDRFASCYVKARLESTEHNSQTASKFCRRHLGISFGDLRHKIEPEQWATGSYGLFAGAAMRIRLFNARGATLLAALDHCEGEGLDLSILAQKILEGKPICGGVAHGTEEAWSAILRELLDKWENV